MAPKMKYQATLSLWFDIADHPVVSEQFVEVHSLNFTSKPPKLAPLEAVRGLQEE